MAQFSLEISNVGGPNEGQSLVFPVDEGSTVSIGRAKGNDLVLRDPLVSRYHAAIEIRQGAPYLLDLGSTSGTRLMGFLVPPEKTSGELISNGDECRIGSAFLRVNFRGEVEKEAAAPAKPAPPSMRSRRLMIAALACAAGLLLLLSFGKSPSAGRQTKSLAKLNQPGVYGYLPGSDVSHPHEVRFLLPVSDLLIEFDVWNAVPVAVNVDDEAVIRISPTGDYWRKWQVVLRDTFEGRQRELVFLNADDSRGKGKWAVKNVRAASLSASQLDAEDEEGIQAAFRLAAASALTHQNGPEGLFQMLRELQRLSALLLGSIGDDAYAFPVNLELPYPAPADLQKELTALLLERQNADNQSADARALESVSNLAAALDAEVWRRYYSRLHAIRLDLQAKRYPSAFGNLAVIYAMLPDSGEWRRTAADSVVQGGVSKKVWQHRDRYLQR